MGKTNSKSTNTEAFDHLKSVTQSIDERKRNIPICLLSNKSDQNNKAISLINENSIRLVENVILIWLDSSLSNSLEYNQNALGQIRRLTNLFQTFSDLEQCYQYIKSIKNEKIFLIVSGSFGPQILPRIENFKQIYSIYVFCGNKTNHEVWIKKYQQIKSIHINVKELCDTIRQDIRYYDQFLTPFSIIPLMPIANINELNKEFIYLEIMKTILLEMTYDKTFRQELVNYVRPFYLHTEQLKVIDKFDDNYQIHSPIWWYTRKCFLYSMLRKGFDLPDFEIIYKLAFFIRDLHRDIKKSHLQTHSYQYNAITVFRAARMSQSQFENVEKNKNGLLAFNDFVLTTLERNIALKFAYSIQHDPNAVAILYKISVNPEISSVPYIALNNLTYLSNTGGEILFSMNAIFRINGIEKLNDNLYQIDLIPANKHDQQIKDLVEYIQEVTDGLNGWYKLSKIMMDIKEYNQVENIYNHIYEHTNEREHEERAFLQHELGYINELKNNLPASINYYKQAIQIYSTYLPLNHPTLLSTYTNLASVLEKQGDLNGALEQYQHALNIKTTYEYNSMKQYNNIAKILQQQGKYAEAQQTYEKALQNTKQNDSSTNRVLADTYHNMGGMYYSLKDYSKALSYYKKTIEIDEKSLQSIHPSLSSTYFNIATTYENLQDYQNAIKYAKSAVNTARRTFGNEHTETKEIIHYLEKLQEKI